MNSPRYLATIRKRAMRSCVALVLFFSVQTLLSQDVFYVSPEGDPLAPYDSWGHAANDIQTAIDAATPNAIVLVSNGTYQVTEQIEVNKAVTVQSLNGPELTTVSAAVDNTRVFNITHEDALVTGFTISNGHRPAPAPSQHGANINMTAGTVSNCVVTAGTCNRGSIVYMTGGLFTHGVISNNTETGNSGGTGGAWLQGGEAIIEHSVLTDNRSGTAGGSMTLVLNGDVTARNLIISHNRAGSSSRISRAVAIAGAGSLLQNCLIVDNPGRGIHMTAAGRVEHCTVSRNQVFGNAGNGLYMNNGTVANSIFYYNGSGFYPSLRSDVLLEGGSISNSCAGVSIEGEGNTTSPPLFSDPDGADFSLLPGSPAIDTGALLAEVTSDMEGNPRPVDGNGDSTDGYDMGAFEAPVFNTGNLRCGFSTPTHEAIGSLEATFTPHVAGTNTTVTYAGWDFGDGTTVERSDLEPVVHQFSPGLFTISLTVSNTANETATTIINHYITVAPDQAFVAEGAGNTPPFDTWETAAADIHDAINILLHESDELRSVTISNGTYTITEQVIIRRPFLLQSVNGPEVTTIRRSSGNTRVMYLDHPSARVNGLTLAGGAGLGQHDHGLGVFMTSGTVSNCWFTDNVPNRSSSVRMTGGLMTHSRIFDNRDTGNSGGNSGATLSGDAILEWTTIEGNEAGREENAIMALVLSDTSIARYCTIVSNKVNGSQGVSHTYRAVVINGAGALLQNSLIADNPGRGVHMTANATVESCTITRNTFHGNVDNGLYMSAGTVRNSIIWNNGSDNSNNTTVDGGTFIFSNTNPSQTGEGNQNVNPAFIDPDAQDYRLDSTSLMINAGTNQVWMESAVDLNGDPRVIADIVDLGAFEAPEPDIEDLSCNFVPSVTEGIGSLSVDFTTTIVGGNTNITHYEWNFGDGTMESGSDLSTITHVFTDPGLYDISLFVRNSDNVTATRTNAAMIYVAPWTVYVAPDGDHEFPFDTWQRAASDIQSAIDSARVFPEGFTTVLITNGLYEISEQIELIKGITVRSINGRDHTVVRRAGGSQRIFWVNHADAVLDGVTMTNGSTSGLLLNNGSVLNSTVTHSSGDRSGARWS